MQLPQKFKHLLSRDQLILVISGICSMIASLYVVNDKGLILSILGFGILLFIFTKYQVIQIIFFMLILVLPYEHGLRFWTIAVNVPSAGDSIFGYSFYFGISLKIIFSIALLLLLVIRIRRVASINQFHYWFLLSWWILTFISVLSAPYPDLAFPFIVRMIVPATVIAATIILNQTQKIYTEILLLCMLTFLLQSAIGVVQFITQHTMNIFIEETANRVGFYTTDGIPLFRSSGLMGHPTFYGSFMSMAISILISTALYVRRRQTPHYFPVTLFILILAGFATIASFSRSAWISVFATILIMSMWHKKTTTIPHHFKMLIAAIVILLAMSLTNVLPFFRTRLASFSSFFTSGNGPGRITLVEYAVQMIRDSPLIGVGPNHFTRVMSTYGLNDITRGFTYPVHNTFMLIASESGILTSLSLTIFVGYSLIKSYPKTKTNYLSGGLWLAAVCFLLNSQVHPLLNQDPTFDYFALLIGLLNTL